MTQNLEAITEKADQFNIISKDFWNIHIDTHTDTCKTYNKLAKKKIFNLNCKMSIFLIYKQLLKTNDEKNDNPNVDKLYE